ncbi:complement C1q-like protein 3 [Argopecten irradians]|uniref:complement C1q-like protein 3 n=1 Tax=Argopecten irradians TaxID=31199 RepID=UPI00371DBC76
MAVCIISCPVVLLLFSVAQLGDAVAPPQKNTDLTSQMADMRKEFQSKIDCLLQVIQEKDDIHATETAKLQKQVDMLKDGCCQNDPRSSSSGKRRNSSEDVPENDIMSPQTVIRGSSERSRGVRPQSRDRQPSLSARVVQTSRTYVAFYSYVKQHLTNLGHNQPIIFDKVVTNVGNAYDLQSGMFRCGVSGIYVFNIHLLALPGKDIQTELMKDGSAVGYVYAGGQSGTFDHGGNTVILELAEGDSVWLRNTDFTQPGATLDFLFSTFSGFLLFPY